ncbi:MAG: translation initiation factor IF-3 [Gammaproteobacteria bacterium]|nr:translation initiation factor IF-3 [Gammaproteobacteria bacterium]
MQPQSRQGNKSTTRINEEITTPEVRLLGAEKEQFGIVSIEEAQSKALAANLDLVEIAPTAKPPVCRIMDYGKFLFEEKKKKANEKKKQKQVQVKEIKLRPGTEEGDYQVKLRNLTRFLSNGDKTKITIRFRGREMAHRELGMDVLNRIAKDLEEISNIEQMPKLEGRQMVMVLSPVSKK